MKLTEAMPQLEAHQMKRQPRAIEKIHPIFIVLICGAIVAAFVGALSLPDRHPTNPTIKVIAVNLRAL